MTRLTLVNAYLMSTSGAIIYLIAPVLIGTVMDSLAIDADQAGLLLAAYFAGYTLITTSAVFWLGHVNMRTAAWLSSLVFVVALLAGADGEGLSKRLGSLSVRQLREEGVEALALASLLARIGTSAPNIAQPLMAEIIAEFDINSFGRATPKFAPDELMQINARVLQQLDFSVVNGRLSDIGLGSIDEGFWLAVRGNITILTEVADWWAVCHQPVVPEIEDPDLLAVALEKLPEGPFGQESWSVWTKAVGTAAGKKGKSLFMPLRKALTGRAFGPDMGVLLCYMKAETVRQRLAGQTA